MKKFLKQLRNNFMEVYDEKRALKKENSFNKFNPDLKRKKKMIVFNTPTHGNLGDQAIAYAQKKFIEEKFSEFYYLEIIANEVYDSYNSIKSIVNDDDILWIQGGGNFGTLYNDEERRRRFIVKNFRKNYIISFPQSIYFSKDWYGKSELNKSKKIFKDNKKFMLAAREGNSFQIMNKEFENSVLLSPDIVLSLNEIESNYKREGILTAFRNDIEKNINDNFKNNLAIELKKAFKKVIITDTVIPNKNDIDENTRYEYLNVIWDQFRKSEVVITDRLHGVIFSCITQTPCIVINNNNKKIEYSYFSWLKKQEYITFIDTNNYSIDLILEEINKLRENKYQYLNYRDEFEEFTKIIRSRILEN